MSEFGTVDRVRNVNDALNRIMARLAEEDWPPGHENSRWRIISPRGLETFEWKGVYATQYLQPTERVLFSAVRDANPFFHFFESLWILGGKSDVESLAQFNPRMREFSDNGITFHAPYGHRLRNGQAGDQILTAVKMLREDRDTRQVVLQIWEAKRDLNVKSKDIPCNDLIFLKIRDGALNMTVACRSNDIIWGAYGANAVQFSMIQEFIAASVGVDVGTYTQFSDSFHVYTNNEAFKRLLDNPYHTDLYSVMTTMRPYPIFSGKSTAETWLRELAYFLHDPAFFNDEPALFDPFFSYVAVPLWEAWHHYKRRDYDRALKTLDGCLAYDWSTACQQWIKRRI